MDEINDQPQVIYTASTPLFKKKLFQAGMFLAISPLFVLAFLWLRDQPLFQSKKQTIQNSPSSATLKTITESELPIALDILKNPMVYEWRGSVEGTLTKKDDKSITLTDDKGQKITILVDLSPNGTKFFYLPKVPNKTKSADNYIKLDNIPIGSKLTGEFWVFLDRKNEMKGGSFTVINQ